MKLIKGTIGSDYLAGFLKEINEIRGLQDSDTLLGGRLGDTLVGGQGDDLLWGDTGNDLIEGNTGYDVLFGSTGNDTIRGGEGNDFISGGKDDDVIFGGKGDDVVSGNSGDDVIDGNSGDDYLFGTKGNDTLNGGAGDDHLDGGSDNDVLKVSAGNDSYRGGSGFDTLDLSNVGPKTVVTIDLSKHEVKFASHGVEFVSSTSGIEQIVANDAGINVMGSKHDEVFVGGAGNDMFRGKGGADVFTGGNGSDTFEWLKKDVTDGKAVDAITDFEVGIDHLDLADFVKGGQAYDKVLRLEQTDNGVLVQGAAKGVWTDIVVLHGLDINAVGADHHQMSLGDLGLLV